MNKYLKRIIFFTIVAQLGLAANLWAATFYVDNAHPDASDSNAGTESKPWKTIQRGADIAVGGDTVYVKDGVYYEAVKMRRSGSSGKYITFRNYPGDNPAVDGSKISDEKLVWWYSDGVRKNYIEWDGIDVRNSKKNGMWVVGTHNIIKNSKIHHNGTPNSTGHTGLQTTYTDNIVISNNEIYNNGWNGLSVENTSNAVIESNIVRDNSDHAGINVFPSPGLSQSSQVANHIRFNLVYNNGTGIYSRYQFNNEISNNLIYNNKDGGIFFHTESSGSSNYNSYTKIYNNTIAGNGWHSIVSQGASYLTITNNIITSTSISLSGSGHITTDNLFYGTSESGSNAITGDPRFVNLSSGDYSLASASPAIDKGKDLTTEGITRDIIDKSRPQANGFDLGSYEYGGVSKSLEALTITGPSSVTESSTGTFTATATWSDDSTSTVTPLWAENSEYATISTGGVLATTSVSQDQTVNVSASYTSGDTVKTAATSVVITDFSTAVPPDAVKPSLESITSPMQIVSATNDPVDSYIETTTSNSGSVVYSFDIDQAGLYKIVAMVYAANDASDSFVVKIDDGPENTWDMNPEGDPYFYGVWREDEVNARGTGTFDAPQFDPLTVELAAGTHTITFIGRESNARLAYSYLVMDKEPSLTDLTITGPTSITESSSGTYTATATWSDDSSSTVTPLWTEDSEYATISTGGVLATTSVSADQAVNVSASYTSGDTVKTAATSVVITDSSIEVPADSVKPKLESITSPMQIVSAPDAPVDSYIETTTSNSGSAVYSFDIDKTGLYKIVAMVYAADSASDSFVVKIDDGPENTWDMNPEGDPNLYGVWREDEVAARGTGTFDAPQFDPLTVELEAGTHTITFIGRESKTRLAYSYLMLVEADSTPPSTEPSPAEGEASPLLLFRAEAGELTAETMEIVSALDTPGGSYITPTSSTSSSAVYNFNLAQPGRYKIVAEVFAADNASDSFLVRIDDGLEDTWDMNPEGDPGQYGIWRQDEVTARGSGTFDAPQFDPLKLQFAAGNHTISITGRELNSRLAYFYLIRVPAGTELIEAESGTLTEPMLVVLGTEASGGAYVETSTRDSGSAVYSFDITEPGNYKVVGRTYSADAGSDSFKVKIDDGTEDIWDVNPKEDPALYNVWRQAEVTARGTGTFDNPQYVPLTVPLEAGKHTITFSGRETNTALDNVYLMQITTTTEPSIIKLEIE